MASPIDIPSRVCVICHEDCSNRPRVKDRQGRYYCQECYERAKKRAAERRPAAAAPKSVAARRPARASAPLPHTGPDDGGFAALAAAAAEAANAVPVEVPRPVSAVPTARPAVPRVTVRAERKRSSGMPEALKQPWVCFVVPVVVLGLLFIVASGDEKMAGLFVVPQSLFGLTIGVLVVIQAFRESVGTGILTLCLPFYVIYFVFSVNASAHLKALFGAALLANIASFWLGVSLADSLQPGY